MPTAPWPEPWAQNQSKSTMRPQPDEPCVNCKLWDGRTEEGCKEGHYNSASMIIFGYCGFCKPKRTKKEEGA